MEKNGSELDLPGFRFHPTEEELLEFYLRRATAGKKLTSTLLELSISTYMILGTSLIDMLLSYSCGLVIGFAALAKMGEREWYFFVPRDRRQANGGRPNRTTERGFWKATGSDRPIRSAANPRRLIGLKKTLVFYLGRAPHGNKTDWVMNEYRLPDVLPTSLSVPQPPKEDIVLCKIYRKATSQKELEQRAAMEASRASQGCTASATSSDQENLQKISYDSNEVIMEMKVELSCRQLSLIKRRRRCLRPKPNRRLCLCSSRRQLSNARHFHQSRQPFVHHQARRRKPQRSGSYRACRRFKFPTT
ncbi:hypothetical protein IEQ34_004805 [Dendrobium chrysotoxum]|uniref:NAC domain-containing protein n=1 Tax=Dendrobium chrysotoxum TaxID=161865 RepID=A0AAV7HA04_DENCH|nr:hypothetical protein IEQ34_004805 [Dendrobium chrysotoxum]